jgi:5,5'-dehydrodivanillate O-demethylase
MGGLLWGYLGPQPAPLVPRLDGYVAERAIRTIGITRVEANWVQIMENSLDPVHTEWLHGALYEFIHEKENVKVAIARHHKKIAFDEFRYGIIKRRLMEGQSEDVSDWRDGHPVVFPGTLAVGSGGGLWQSYQFQIRVPIDDETTEHYWYMAYVPPADAEVPQHLLDRVPSFPLPQRDAEGEYKLDFIFAQDVMAWETQGRIAKRHLEALGTTDRGVIMFRNMLKRELLKVEAGEDPIGVIRDPEENRFIELPLEKGKDMNSDGFEAMLKRNFVELSPVRDEIVEVYRSRREPASV